MQPKQLYDALKAKYPLRGGIPEVTLCCVFCDDTRFRLGINLVKRTGQCFNCGETLSPRKLLELVQDTLSQPNDLDSLYAKIDQVKAASYRHFVFPETKALTLSGIPIHEYKGEGRYRPLYEEACDYLRSRGFDPHLLSRYYGVLLADPESRESGRIILPVFEGEKMVYYQARAVFRQVPKYLNPSKQDVPAGKSHFVFNLDQASRYEEIVICEGIFSALAVGTNAVALMGKQMSEMQEIKIKRKAIPAATILLDPGTYREALHIARRLSPQMKVRVALLEKGDPNEVSPEELKRVLLAAKDLSTIDFFDL